jgi:beta-alanine degradation protein BauB
MLMVRFTGMATVFVLGFGTSMLISQGGTKTERFPQFENDEVKVWKTVVQPHEPLPLHRHDHGRVIVALSGGMMNVVSSKGEVEPHPWETGKAYWLPKMAPGTMHTDQNAGDKPIEVMVVELKNDK